MKSKFYHFTGVQPDPICLLTTDYDASGVTVMVDALANFSTAQGLLRAKPSRTADDSNFQFDTIEPNFYWTYFIGADMELWLQFDDPNAEVDVKISVSQVY